MTMLTTRRRVLGTGAALLGSLAMRPRAMADQPPVGDKSQPLKFLAIGDWGQHGSDAQRRVAAAMARVAETDGARFVISLGDNFYTRGVQDVADPQWQTSFENVYTDKSLQCPWYPVLGNHDRNGKAMAQVAYSQVSTRWTMPAAYYWHSETLGNGDKLDLFFLDTNMIISERSGVHALLPGDDADDQLEWLELALAASRARWKVVIGHHPVYSGGPHGTSQVMLATVEPIIRRHRVSAYVCGHDHNMQHLRVDGMTYVISGSGASINPVTASAPGTVFTMNSLGFLRAEASPEALSFTFIDGDGVALHTATIDATA